MFEILKPEGTHEELNAEFRNVCTVDDITGPRR